jgi:hypothetical protein
MVQPALVANRGEVVHESPVGMFVRFTEAESASRFSDQVKDALEAFNHSCEDRDQIFDYRLILGRPQGSWRTADLQSLESEVDCWFSGLPGEGIYYDARSALQYALTTPQSSIHLRRESNRLFSNEFVQLSAELPVDGDDFRDQAFDFSHAKPATRSDDLTSKSRASVQALLEGDIKLELDTGPRSQPAAEISKTQPIPQLHTRKVVGKSASTSRQMKFLMATIGLGIVVGSVLWWQQFHPANEPQSETQALLGAGHSVADDEDYFGIRSGETKKKGEADDGVFGKLVIEVEPADSEIRLNGKLIAKKSPVVLPKVALSEHTLEIRRPGFVTYTQLFNLSEPELHMNIALKRRR